MYVILSFETTNPETPKQIMFNISTVYRSTFEHAFRRLVSVRILPETLDWKGPGTLGTLRITADSRSDATTTVLNYNLAAHIRPALIPSGSYAQILDINRRLTHPSSRRILLTKESTKMSGL